MKNISIYHILVTAILFRIIWMVLISIIPVSDSSMYHEFALSIVEGNGYAYPDGKLTAYWPVGTSAIYAFIYAVLGADFFYIGLFNLILGAGIVFLVWKVCSFYFDELTSKIAAVLIAVWPLMIQSTTVLSSELIFIFMLLILLWVWNLKLLPIFMRGTIFGILIGLTCYIRPIALPLIFILPVLSVIRRDNIIGQLKMFSLSLFWVILITAPWSYRNTQLNNQFTYLSTNFGPNLWMGNNINSVGSYMSPPTEGFNSEKHRDDSLRKAAINFIVDNPKEYFKLIWKRTVITFSRETIGVHWNIVGIEKRFGDNGRDFLKYLSTLFWLSVFFLAIIGAIYRLKNKGKEELFSDTLVITGFFFIIPILTVGQDRYHLPLIPFVAFYAANILSTFYVGYRKKI